MAWRLLAGLLALAALALFGSLGLAYRNRRLHPDAPLTEPASARS